MDLEQFIASDRRQAWIVDSGLKYYVRKSYFFPELIELANCSALRPNAFAYWRFMRRYVKRVPFMAEQVINVPLARYYELTGWHGRTDCMAIPSYMSPLAVEQFKATEYYYGYAPGSYVQGLIDAWQEAEHVRSTG